MSKNADKEIADTYRQLVKVEAKLADAMAAVVNPLKREARNLRKKLRVIDRERG